MARQGTEIIAVAAGEFNTAGLCKDGTVVAIGLNEDGQCDVGDWTDIIAIAVGDRHIVGLKSDGSVVSAGEEVYEQRDVDGWHLQVKR